MANLRAGKIRDLFSEDALYFYSPWDEDLYLCGRESIVADWLRQPDAVGSWDARYVRLRQKTTSPSRKRRTTYHRSDGSVDRQFDNIFVPHFDDASDLRRTLSTHVSFNGVSEPH